jgi:hypothetical protein
MKKSLYVLAIFLVIAWIIGYFSTNIGDIIHILLAMAIIVVLISVLDDSELLKKLKNQLK